MILNPDMIKEMLMPQNVPKLHKYHDFVGPLSSIMAKGIFFVENNLWKFHRKTLSKVFNYDFITSQIPMMNSIADKMFD
jgi:cytochrome P450